MKQNTTEQAVTPEVDEARAKAIKLAEAMAAKTRPELFGVVTELVGSTPLPTQSYQGFQDRDRWYEAGTYTSHKDERAALIAWILRSRHAATHAEVGTALALHTPKYSGAMCAKGRLIAEAIEAYATETVAA